MTICSPSGAPPRSSSRLGSSPASTVIDETPVGTKTISPGLAVASPTLTVPVSRGTRARGRVDRDVERRAGGRVTSAPTSSVCIDTGETWPKRLPRKTSTRAPSTSMTGRRVVLEARLGEAVGLGQGHPQLGTVQCRRGRGGVLGVRDAAAGGHEVDLAGPHEGVRAGGVAVLDLAGEEPRHGLQAGVRVARHDHAAGQRDVGRTVVVDEAPRADERALALGQAAPHEHGPRTAERHLAARQHDRIRGGRPHVRRTSLRWAARSGLLTLPRVVGALPCVPVRRPGCPGWPS